MWLAALAGGCSGGAEGDAWSKPAPESIFGGDESPGEHPDSVDSGPGEGTSGPPAVNVPTGVPAQVGWQPGGEIVGWPDYPCEELYDLPTVYEMPVMFDTDIIMGGCWSRSECSVERPATLALNGGQCEQQDESCEPYFYAHFFGDLDVVGEPRGQGWYTRALDATCGLEDSSVSALVRDQENFVYEHPGGGGFYSSLTDWCNYDFYTELPSEIFLCISRLRPDQLRGVLWFHGIHESDGGWVADSDEVWAKVPLEVNFADHAGLEGEWDPDYEFEVPDEVWEHIFRYRSYDPDDPGTLNASYDTAWPWEDILNPLVRAQVYNRYLPYGPDYQGE